MGKSRVKSKYLALIVLLTMLLCSSAVFADNINDKTAELRLEQAHANMPEIKVYYYADASVTDKPEEISASLAGEKLSTDSVQPYDASEGVDYYFLLDISASIADVYFEDVKAALVQMCHNINDADTITLITFGDEVNVIFEKKNKTDDVESVIAELQNDDMTTALFQAIDKTAQMAGDDPQFMRRKVAVVLSDGEDCTVNKATNNEALDTLVGVSMPVYAIAVEKTTRGEENPYINAFGEFARQSGGLLYVLPEASAGETLSGLVKEINAASVLTLKSETNQTSSIPQPLAIAFGERSPKSIQLLARHAVKDESIPTAEAEQSSNKSFTVTFSEKVLGASQPENYIVKSEDGTVIPVALVTYAEGDENRAILNFEEEFYNGTYEVSYQNITDISAEGNKVESVNTIEITDGLVEDSDLVKFFKQYWPLFTAIAAVLIVLAVVLVIYSRIKKNKGVMMVGDKPVLGTRVETKNVVQVREQKGRKIEFVVRGSDRKENVISSVVINSLIVGRSESLCGLVFKDPYLSKQHFVIEDKNEGFYIMDLGTENGTMVNGVRIHQSRQLHPGDTIAAGKVEMQVRW